MTTWNPDEMRLFFVQIADGAEGYAKQLSEQIKRDPSQNSQVRRQLHDEYLARWYAHDFLRFSDCLKSRQAFLAEMKEKLARKFDLRDSQVFSNEQFEKHWRSDIQALIAKYEGI